jgi:hypothetical protein
MKLDRFDVQKTTKKLQTKKVKEKSKKEIENIEECKVIFDMLHNSLSRIFIKKFFIAQLKQLKVSLKMNVMKLFIDELSS